MTDQDPPIRWNIEQRLGFIDRRLYWDAQINRSDLMSYFSISTPQASADLAHYERVSPGNMIYDSRAKAYVAAPTFKPRLEPSARIYLAQLQLMADGVLSENETWLGNIPQFGIVPRVRRKLEAKVLQQILEAMRRHLALEIRYQSMQTSEPTSRWIAPHALSFDGHRWHARAWCHQRQKFLDFVLARVIEVMNAREDGTNADDDIAWHSIVKVRLGPNPKLSLAQQEAVELDYGMIDSFVEVEVRLSLVYYLKRQMMLDLADLLPPERIQVILLNDAEINLELQRVGESTV